MIYLLFVLFIAIIFMFVDMWNEEKKSRKFFDKRSFKGMLKDRTYKGQYKKFK